MTTEQFNQIMNAIKKLDDNITKTHFTINKYNYSSNNIGSQGITPSDKSTK